MSASAQPMTTVARGRMPLPAWLRMGLFGGSVLGLSGFATWAFILPGKHMAPPTQPPSVYYTPGKEIVPPAAEAAPPPAKSGDMPGPAPMPTTIVHPMQVWGMPGNNTPAQRGLISQTLSNPGGLLRGGGRDQGDDQGADNGGTETAYGAMLRPTKTTTGEAVADQDVSLLLPESTTFGCIPQSPIDTQLPGGIACIVDENVWSQDGSNILIHKFDKVSGEIQHGLSSGQDRAFILWTKVRSKRVRADLNSPATDSLGQMGAPGFIDEHWWPRIKAAVMLTGVETASGVAQAMASQHGTTSFNLNAGQSLAQTALQHDINIPTTLWRGQGWPLRVYVQHDIQFRRAYNDVLLAGGAR